MSGRTGAARLHAEDGRSRSEGIPGLDALYDRVVALDRDIDAALDLAVELGDAAPRPGGGDTVALWQLLATIAAADLAVARAIEPHLDALAVLAEAAALAEDQDDAILDDLGVTTGSTWGVFAAEGGEHPLQATADAGGRFVLSGTKPWCSLAGRLSHALVTAHTGDGRRRLFAVSLRGAGVSVREGTWHASGLSEIPSGPVDFEGVPARPVGADEWYLARAGFAWGGIGVAAIWWGGAVGVARRIAERVLAREPDQLDLVHFGATDVEIETARLALRHAAELVDGGTLDRSEARILAQRTRTIVVHAAEEVLRRSFHALGPSPLALEHQHARRVADLELYLRQDHAERDEAALGRALVGAGGPAW